MDLTLHHGSVALERLGGLSLQDAAGVGITCLAGRLWITQEGDGRDFVLGPGQSLRIARAGLTLVSAIESSRLSVRAPRRRRFGHRWWLPVRRLFRFLDCNYGPRAIRACTRACY